jgi:hypothetical protein
VCGEGRPRGRDQDRTVVGASRAAGLEISSKV